MITDQPPLDWTCDADGLSDSSPKFLQVMAHIQDLINSNTHHILMPERATTLARLITAQIAHIDHLVPADDHRSALQEANETFVSPVFLNIVSSPEARELQAIDNILARRTALDDFKSRGEKIFAAIDRAAEADRF